MDERWAPPTSDSGGPMKEIYSEAGPLTRTWLPRPSLGADAGFPDIALQPKVACSEDRIVPSQAGASNSNRHSAKVRCWMDGQVP